MAVTLSNKETDEIEKKKAALPSSKTIMDMRGVVSIILGGGRGTRLFPLTETRSKPAISFGGRYRLIDIPISSALNSGCGKIFVLSQFLSTSLQQHIVRTYHRDPFSRGFVEVLSPQETQHGIRHYKGTADAVRQNLPLLENTDAEFFLILSGDQLYQIDFQEMLKTAIEKDADLVISALPVRKEEAKRMGLLRLDNKGNIQDFAEKPDKKERLDQFIIGHDRESTPWFLGSMGIYLFRRRALIDLLNQNDGIDFGKHLIPGKIESGKVACHLHTGYWEDVGTIGSLYQANLALTSQRPPLDCYDESTPIYTHFYNLPGPRITNARIKQSIICEGSFIEADEVTESILGPRTRVKSGSVIRRSYLMGNDKYAGSKNATPYAIENDVIIERAIIDRHVHIGEGARLLNLEGRTHYDGPNIYIRDGIIVVPEGAVIPPGFIL